MQHYLSDLVPDDLYDPTHLPLPSLWDMIQEVYNMLLCCNNHSFVVVVVVVVVVCVTAFSMYRLHLLYSWCLMTVGREGEGAQ